METTNINAPGDNGNFNDPADDGGGHYVPGVCNVGKAEFAKRKKDMYYSLILLGMVIIALEGLNIDRLWKLTIFLPALIAALCFQQWYYKFCFGFGMKGLYNFGEMGKTFTVTQKEYAEKDRAKALRMLLRSFLFAIGFTVLIYFV